MYDWRHGDQSALPALANTNQRDRFLYQAELARLQQIDQGFDASRAAFDEVIDHFREEERRARFRLGEGLYSSASLLSNETLMPYEFAPYEHTFVYLSQAFNFLAMGNIEAAGVELRRARLEQDYIAQQYESDLEAAYAQAEEEGVNVRAIGTGIDRVGGEIKKAFQDAYTFYLSAVFWEATGDLNAALVDYKKALELNPDNPELRRAVDRLERRQAEPSPNLWIFYEQGQIQAKRAIEMTVPNYHGEFISVAMPDYPDAPPARSLLQIELPSETRRAQSIADFSNLARQHLDAKLPILMARQVLRALAKYQLQQRVGDKMGDGARLLAAIYSIVTERADLRSWLSLPDNVQVLPLYVAEGQHSLNLSSATISEQIDIQVKPGERKILRIIDTLGYPHIHLYSLPPS